MEQEHIEPLGQVEPLGVEAASLEAAASRQPQQQDDGLVAPAQAFQPKLTAKERASRRAESEQMAREKKLVQVQVRRRRSEKGGAWHV